MKKKIIQYTLNHWNKMIEWVKKQKMTGKPNSEKMYEQIGENWYGEYCPLCRQLRPDKNVSDCIYKCPLGKAFGVCSNNQSKNYWSKIDKSRTWKTWLSNAIKLRRQIKSLLKN